MKNIGYFIEDSRFGGPHAQICYHLKSKTASEHKNFLFINSNDSKLFVKNLNKENINFSFIKISALSLKITKIFKYLFFFIKDIRTLLKVIKNNELDVVVGSNGSSCIKTVIAGYFSKAKVFLHIHDTRSPTFLFFVIKIIFSLCDGLIFASKKSKEYYLGEQNKKKYLILNSSIEILKCNNIQNRNLKKKIGFFGNINDDKDVLYFLDIVKEFKVQKNNDLKFILFGQVWENQKKYFQKCKKFIYMNNLNNLELILNSEIPAREKLIDCDILIVTSKNESSPLIVREAMCSGIVVVSNFVGDMTEIIDHDFNGYLVRKDINRYIDTINNLYQSIDKINKIKDNSIKYASDNFNIENYSKKLNEFF